MMASAHEQARGGAAGGATSSVVVDASELKQRGSKGHKKPDTDAEDDDKESGRGAAGAARS
jgi:hypothetical protein